MVDNIKLTMTRLKLFVKGELSFFHAGIELSRRNLMSISRVLPSLKSHSDSHQWTDSHFLGLYSDLASSTHQHTV